MTTAATFDREQIRNWISEATGEGLSVSDALPDSLAATAEVLGLDPCELRLWIFEHSIMSTRALVQWARRHDLVRNELNRWEGREHAHPA